MRLKNFIGRYLFLRNIPIRQKLIVYFLLVTIIPLTTVSLISYMSAENTIEKNAGQHVEDMLGQASKNIDFYLEETDNLIASMLFDRSVRSYMYMARGGTYERAIAKLELKRTLAGIISPRKYIKQIYIVGLDGTVFSSNINVNADMLMKQSWFMDVYSGEGTGSIVPTHDSSQYTQSQMVHSTGDVITVVRRYTDTNNNTFMGVIAVDLDYAILEDIFSEISISPQAGEIMLVTNTGQVAYHSDKTKLGFGLDADLFSLIRNTDVTGNVVKIDTIDTFISSVTSDYSSWHLVRTIPIRHLLGSASSVRYTIFIIGLLCVLIAVALSIGISYHIANPILELSHSMKTLEEEDFDTGIDVTSEDEVGQLAQSFNHMAKRIKELIQDIYYRERSKREAELHMLQQQINPHFLYNTLDSIKWMAKMQNANNISSIIIDLIKLLRLSVHSGNEFITVREEIECVRSYINIQKFRYGDSFEVVYDIEDRINDTFVIKMILQPLVENALLHGFRSRKEDNTIRISGYKELDNLVLMVEDNGEGMSEDKFNEILTISIDRRDKFSSVGIPNIQQRIKLYYGEEYGMSCHSSPGKGTTVRIVIPISGGER